MAGEPLGDPDAYGDDRAFAYLRNEDEPDEELGRRDQALGGAGHPTTTVADRSAAPDLGRIFFFASSPIGRGGLGARDQPVRPARTCRRRRTTRAADPRGGLPDEERPRREPAGGARAAEVHRDRGLRDAVGGVRRRGGRPAPRSRGRHGADRRSATARATCTRRASTTRAARRTACSSQLLHQPPGEDFPWRSLCAELFSFGTLKHAQALGDLADACGSTGSQVVRIEVHGPDERQEVDLMQLGFVGL